MTDTPVNPLAHFGKQVKNERLARGWSLPELERRTGIDAGHWSRIERGVRPPTEMIAARCDEAFPERRGWFGEYYTDSRSWAPPGYRSWTEEENSASTLCDWCPSIITGLLQTEDYARGLLSVHPDVTGEVVATRLAGRMARQDGCSHGRYRRCSWSISSRCTASWAAPRPWVRRCSTSSAPPAVRASRSRSSPR